jgi:hypothetical protein
VVLLLPLAACAGTDASGEAAGTTTSGSSATAGASATQDAPEQAPQESAPAAEEQRIEVAVAGGRVSGDTGRVPVAVGTQVTLVITGDAADEVHVHGYDRTADLAAGTPAELSFAATIPGVFEVELHEAGTALLALQVS